MPFTPTTLDPAAKSTRITLAADELTVTAASSGYSHVRSRLAVSSGKYYVEFARSDGSFMFGVVPAGASLDMYAGGAGAGVGLYSNSIYQNGHVVQNLAWGASEQVPFGLLLDADARTVTFRSPLGLLSDAISIPFSGDIYLAAGSGSSSTPSGNIKANFGATSFAMPVPQGYTPGFGTVVTYPISGNVKDASGANAARTVRIYRRSDGMYIGSTTSDPTTGNYSFDSFYGGEMQRIVLDDDAGTLYNDLIDRVLLP